MSIFSKIADALKSGLRKVAPALIDRFAPAGFGGVFQNLLTGPRQGSILSPPGIIRPPLPGAGRVPTRAQRFPSQRAPSQALRKRVITPGPVSQQMSIFSAIPGILRGAPPVLARAGRILTGRTATAATGGVLAGQFLAGRGGDGGACPSGWHLNKQDGVGGAAGTYCVRNRRTNFGNARAARRSVRRLKGARKLLRDIEKMMPSRPRARRAPTGHSAHLHHTGG